jgi:hypothetical protein
MSITVSTKFKELILGPNSFSDIFNGGRILLYSGEQPAHADLAVLVPAIAEITTNGTVWTPGGPGGLTYSQSGMWILKNPSVNWKLKCINSGTPTWFRIVGPDVDDGVGSVNLPRVDGAVSDNDTAEFVLPTVSLEVGQVLSIQQFLYTIPPIL